MEESKKAHKLQIRRIAQYYWSVLKDYKNSQYVILIAIFFGEVAATLVVPLLGQRILNAADAGGPEAYGIMMQSVLFLACAIVVYNILFRLADHQLVSSQSRILKDLYDLAHRNLQQKSYDFYTNTFAGSLIAKTKRFVSSFETLQDIFVWQIWMGGFGFLFTFSALSYQSWILGAIVLVWVAFYIALVSVLVKRLIPKSLRNAEADSATTAHYSDIISNVLTVKMFGRARKEEFSFEETTTAQDVVRRDAWLQQHFWNNIYQGIAVGVFEVALMGTVVYLWNQGAVSTGTILLVQVYAIVIFDIVWQMGRSFVRSFTAISDANEMVEIMDQPVGVGDSKSPEPVRFSEGRVQFADVSYRYNGGAGRVFEGFDLELPPGQRVALVGHSGAGKTTIVKLLLRFVDVEQGEILIDGQNIAHVAQEDLRRHIAYVPQEPLLFHRTLFENIAYGKEDATREEVEEVAKRARAHDFIAALPQGYDTLVGERGIKLSGGERQRVAIARALIKDAPIVILDEATSSLDSVSEQHIQLAFDELMKGRTTIVIAHRLSTIKHMDRIVVLDKGTVAEDGTHDELLKKDGIYAELWTHQVGGFIGE